MGLSRGRVAMSRFFYNAAFLWAMIFSNVVQAADDDPVRMLIKNYDRDTYSTMDGLLYIRTYQCLEPAYSESAILFYIPYSDDNKLRFSNGVECKVLEIYDRGAHYSREGR